MKNTKNKGFTLVELLIIITIISILSTIAFISFSKYGVNSRDVTKSITLANIEKGLNSYFITTGAFPLVDEQSNTGQVNGEELSMVGVIGENISRLISLQSIPLDPVSGNKYAYGVSYDKKYFQVAGTIESQLSDNFVSSTYAKNFRAKVSGNYPGIIKKGNKIYNLPSLIFTGDGNLLSPNTFLVINNGENLPYKISSITPDNSIPTNVVLKNLTNREDLVFTGMILPQTKEELMSYTGGYHLLGYSLTEVGSQLFGTKVYHKADFDLDGDIDKNDVSVFTRMLHQGKATKEYDFNNDGVVSVSDSRALVFFCTRNRCAE